METKSRILYLQKILLEYTDDLKYSKPMQWKSQKVDFHCYNSLMKTMIDRFSKDVTTFDKNYDMKIFIKEKYFYNF